jgi:hypothetical protein
VDVNLTSSTSGAADSGDIPFHMSIRFKDEKLVFNNYQYGKWGKEEEAWLPAKKDAPYAFHIRAHQNKFEVFCNGDAVHEFKYRQALTNIQRFMIDGDTTLAYAKIGGEIFIVPYEKKYFLGGPWSRLDVQGVINKDADRFEINVCDKGNVALHISARFDEEALVLNSKNKDGWGIEERSEKAFPMKKGQIFDFTILNTDVYTLHINGDEYTAFSHKLSSKFMDKLEIKGDLELIGVHGS